ncbi:hypothetical protein HCU01_29410 [Halomonas cupida]|uniref:Intracellular growth attenuator protein IgaA n=2 Tax=Halomonas cupida TaxID=44933 RepID=A0ABQ0WH93_9GAMM|nr:hypothetical protein [Halomonas cupida]GEN24992.1 hypothetical protein HCU01_29410 [Halomonas cupida]
MIVAIAGVGLVVLSIAIPVINGSSLPASWHWPLKLAAISLWLTALFTYWWRERRSRGANEVVELDQSGFNSRLFGRVEFSDIVSHTEGRDRSLRRGEITAPSLRLRLTGGRQLSFHLDSRHYAEDLLDYLAFNAAVLAGVRGQIQSFFSDGLPSRQALFSAGSKVTSSSLSIAQRPVFDEVAGKLHQPPSRTRSPARSQSPEQTTDPRPQLGASVARRLGEANRQAEGRRHQQLIRNSKFASWGIALLSLSYLIRACGPEIKAVIDPGPFASIQQQAPQAFERSANSLQRTVAQRGPLYLWGAGIDGNIKPLLMPNITFNTSIGVAAIDTMNASGAISRFLRNGEAEGYRIGLLHNDQLDVVKPTRVSMQPIPGEKVLFFFLLSPEALSPGGVSNVPRQVLAWHISYHDSTELPDRIAQGNGKLPMAIIDRSLQMTPPPRLVVATSEYHGVSSDEFNRVVQALETYYRQQGVTVSRFSTRQFEDGAADE